MKRLLLLIGLLVTVLPGCAGCTVSRPGSQTLEIGPSGVEPAHDESRRLMREATGVRDWGYGERDWGGF